MEEKNDLVEGEPIENAEGEQTPKETEEKPKDDSEGEEEKKNLSAIAQKKHWREKAQILERELAELKAQKDEKKVPDDEAERKAQQYIDDRIEKILEKKATLKVREDEKAIAEFNEDLEEVLEENPDITEKEILDVTEQFLKEKVPVTPKQAVRFIKLSKEPKKEKPKMPSPQRGSAEAKEKVEVKPEEKGNFWAVTDKLLKKIKTEG